MHNLPDNHIILKLKGTGGQSLGAFVAKGITLEVIGEANDYVGKGLSGGIIIVRPNTSSKLISKNNVIIGNTALYGATKGKLYAAGTAGERFCVRNSGAEAVVEGCDSNGCEYMTGGTVVILGKVGDNFGAGMTGGMAFIYDPTDEFEKYVNPESVIWQKIESKYWAEYLKDMIVQHYEETNSSLAKKILDNFDLEKNSFKQICPIEMLDKLKHPLATKFSVKTAV